MTLANYNTLLHVKCRMRLPGWFIPQSIPLITMACFSTVKLCDALRLTKLKTWPAKPTASGQGFSLQSKTAATQRYAGRFKYEVGTRRQKTNMVVSIPQDVPLRFTPGSLTRWRSDTPEYDARLILHSVASDVITNSVDSLSRPAHYLLTSRANLMHTHQTIVQSLIAGASQPTIAPTFSGLLGDFLERIVRFGRAT